MLNYSTRFKELIRSDVRDILYELNITLVDGTSLSINNSQLWGDSLSLEDGTSESGKFTVGAAVSTKLSFGLNNIYGDFNDYSFDRASVVLKIGMMVDGTKEMVQVGKFIVDDADYDSSIISITALDNFIKMDSVVGTISFPTDTRTLVQNICSNCGVTNLADSFLANHNYTIKSFDYSNMTYRALLVYLCQYMGCFAKMDSQGRLTLNWYNDIFDEEEHEGIEVIDSFKSLKLSTDNIVISGVEVVLDDEHSYSLGTQNYVVVVSNNPVIVDEEMAQSLVNRLYVQIGGYSFKKCNADTLMYLWLESGDSIYVKDKDVNYPIFISNRTLNSNGSVSFSCDAETPLRNGSVGNDSNASAIRQLRQDLKKEKNDRERVEEELREEIAGAGGIYETEVDGAEGEGGKIKYLHNKPLLSDSAIQWKFTASTISVSKDYGQTWSFALNSDGQAILNQIYALGINADYIYTGNIQGTNNFEVSNYRLHDENLQLANWMKLSNVESQLYTNILLQNFRLDTTKIANQLNMAAYESTSGTSKYNTSVISNYNDEGTYKNRLYLLWSTYGNGNSEILIQNRYPQNTTTSAANEIQMDAWEGSYPETRMYITNRKRGARGIANQIMLNSGADVTTQPAHIENSLSIKNYMIDVFDVQNVIEMHCNAYYCSPIDQYDYKDNVSSLIIGNQKQNIASTRLNDYFNCISMENNGEDGSVVMKNGGGSYVNLSRGQNVGIYAWNSIGLTSENYQVYIHPNKSSSGSYAFIFRATGTSRSNAHIYWGIPSDTSTWTQIV